MAATTDRPTDRHTPQRALVAYTLRAITPLFSSLPTELSVPCRMDPPLSILPLSSPRRRRRRRSRRHCRFVSVVTVLTVRLARPSD